jgi:hypothetical protein
MKNPPGIKSVLYTATIAKLFSCFLVLAAMRPVTEAATITVTDTGDTIAVDGLVTLREAITSANNNADVNADVVAVGAYGTDTINFNIPGTGVHTIAPFPALPTITDPVIIDGYTQPGSAANTQAVEDDAVLLIELNGANTLDANGLTITAGNSTIRGLVTNRFTGASGSARSAIALSAGGGNVIEGNFLGTDAPGTTGPPFEDIGVSIESGSDNNLIGGTAPSARNVISGNANVALFVATSGNIIQGNFIGTQRDGRSPLGNYQGIGFVGVGNANNNLVGGTVPGAGNIIAFNVMQGVLGEAAAGTGNAILGNSIFGSGNGALGIDWFPEGATLNDMGDSDDGFNKLQNFPVISTVQGSFPSVTLTGSLNSTPNTVFRLEFFGNAGANSSGFGEGGFYLGSTDVTTDANGDASYNVTLGVPGTPASIAYTATATDPAGNTSEFSAAFRTKLLNISTRLQVLTGDGVPIGGFIVTGLSPKKVIVRGIGPSLGPFGVPGALADPTLELHASDGSVINGNDNWKDTQEAEIEATGLMPTNDLESGIVETLDPGAYTAVLQGKDGTTGIGLVEAYDLDQPVDSELANISTRGFVDTADNVMIGGFIIGPEQLGDFTLVSTVVIRAIGPSLGDFGVGNPLQDPTVELHDENGTMIAFNDDWKDSQQAEIEVAQLAPSDDRESAILIGVLSDPYTVIVRGKGDTTGVALVEVYF